jgi:hypothetical protein
VQLPDDAVQQLLEDIAEAGKVYARAKAHLEALRERRKITKASIMKVVETYGVTSYAAQEREAYSHPGYAQHIVELEKAVEAEVITEIAFRNAERAFDAWRSVLSTERVLLAQSR